MGGARPRDAVSRLCGASFHDASGIEIPLEPVIFEGLFKGGKGAGLSLYRLSSLCHAEGLIHAVRFFRKEKSSFLRAGYFLRRTGVPAQTGIALTIGMCKWGILCL